MEEDVPDLNSFGAIIQQEIPHHVHLEYELWVLKQMGWKLNGESWIRFLAKFSQLELLWLSCNATTAWGSCFLKISTQALNFFHDNCTMD